MKKYTISTILVSMVMSATPMMTLAAPTPKTNTNLNTNTAVNTNTNTAVNTNTNSAVTTNTNTEKSKAPEIKDVKDLKKEEKNKGEEKTMSKKEYAQCILTAVKTRNSALKTLKDKYVTEVKASLTVRKTSFESAKSLTEKSAIKTARHEAKVKASAAKEAARDLLKKSREEVRVLFNTTKAACKLAK